jgi:hypothetical protein
VRKVLAGTLLVVALVVAGCGGSSSSKGGNDNGEAAKSGQQVLTDAVNAAEAASSLHMSGQISSDGETIGLDLTIVKGKGATGSLTIKGQTVELVIVGSYAYIKAGAAFWTQVAGSAGSTIASLLGDKWLKVPTSNAQFGQFTAIADSKSLFDSLSSTGGTLTNKGATTYNGQSVVSIFAGSENGTLYVAATGTAYPVAIVKKGAGAGGTVAFDRWNKSVTLTAPSDVVDLSQLGLGQS